MKHQSVIQILLQTLDHYVLWFQSAIDPVNQCLPTHNLSHSQLQTPDAFIFLQTVFSVSDVPNEKQRDAVFKKDSLSWFSKIIRSWSRWKLWQIENTPRRITGFHLFSLPTPYETCRAYLIIYSFTASCMEHLCCHLFQSKPFFITVRSSRLCRLWTLLAVSHHLW